MVMGPAVGHVNLRKFLSEREVGTGTRGFILAPDCVCFYFLGRYDLEAHTHATVENDFAVFKKVCVGVHVSMQILSSCHAWSLVIGWERVKALPD